MNASNNNKTPEISVLIPVYNVENYIERCLLSVFNNTIIDKAEIILVNDASTDKSVFLAKELIQNYSNLDIKMFNHPVNKGLGATRQTALSKATGKYIVCVDSDDWVEPDYLEKLYNKAEETNADMVCCGWFKEETKTTIMSKPFPNESIDALKSLLLGKSTDTVWTKLFKRNIFIDNDFTWDPKFSRLEDTLICIKFLSYANKIENVDFPLYHYNLKNEKSLSRKRKAEYHLYALKVFEAAEEFLKSCNKLNLVNNEFEHTLLYQKIQALYETRFFKNFHIIEITETDFNYINSNNSFSYFNKNYINAIYNKNYLLFLFFDLIYKIRKSIFVLKNIIIK